MKRILTPWVTQPQNPTEVDLNNPLAKNLENVIINSNIKTWAWNVYDNRTTPIIPPVSGKYVNNFFVPDSITSNYLASVKTRITPALPFTILCRFWYGGGESSGDRILYRINGLNNNNGDYLYVQGPDYNTFRRLYPRIQANYIGLNSIVGSTTYVPYGPFTFVYSANGLNSSLKFYDSFGANYNAATLGSTCLSCNGDKTLTVGINSSRPGVVMTWTRQLGDYEVKEVIKNYWQIFRPQ